MKDKLDQHLDQKLRESYDAFQIKAPDGLWERLEEQLPDPVDVLLDQKLKDGYNALPTAKAPPALWSSILDELPQDLDTQLDQKLKESYNEQQLAVPQKVWQAVNRQLNIDKTWLQIESVLDGRALWSKRLLRSLRLVVACLLLLLLLRTCNTDTPNSPIAAKSLVGTTPTVTSAADLEQPADAPQQDQTATTIVPSIAVGNGIGMTVPSTVVPAHPRSQARPSTVPMVLADEGLQVGPQGPLEAVTKAPLKATRTTIPVLAGTILSDNNNVEEGITQDLEGGLGNKPLITKELATLSPEVLPPVMVEPLCIDPEATALANKPQTTPRWTVGVFLVLNSTTLLNNETRMGFDYNSLTINYFGLAANYGLWGRYQFSRHHAVLAEYSINVDHKQAYGVYEKARFRVKELVMKYNRLGLAYQWTLLNNKYPRRLNNQLMVQIGVYGGWLRSARLLYDGKTVYDQIGEYQSFDAGLKFALGHEIQLDNIVFGYGVRSDVGLINIFKGNNQQAANENHTNLLHLGGYLSLGYKF